MTRKNVFVATLIALVLGLDIATKQWALRALGGGEVLGLLGDAVPLTLAFNNGAAFGIHLGGASRWVFLVLSLVALGVLAQVYRQTPASDRLRCFALGLVAAGTTGNLIDRVRWDRGVVDFIGPVDLGFMHWPIFNVADMAITCGAVLLAISLGSEEREPAPARKT